MDSIRIGGGQGFWGDSDDAAVHMVKREALDYMACDYLAELTASIMARQKLKDPLTGYATDFIRLYSKCGKTAKDKGIRILTNAGGMNVLQCVEAVKKTAGELNIGKCRIGYVLGDDLTDQIDDLAASGVTFENMDGVGEFKRIRDRIVNANVYFGHEPIVNCLAGGADVIITGRATDSSLFLAPAIHSLGWARDDWDQLAKGIIAGHLLECGGQGSGGNYQKDWWSVPDMDDLGFPIAEISDSGLVLTKAADCGGLICEDVCKEQLLYEIHDPANYITPDVIADISHATLTSAGPDRVIVGNIKGKPRPDTLKLCIGYRAGYKVAAMLSYAWPDAYEKAQYAAQILLKKMSRKGLRAEDIRVDYIGLNSLHLNVADVSPTVTDSLNEVVLRIAIRTDSKAEAMKLVPEVAPLQLNGPPGASFFGGRAKVQEVIGLWPTLIPRDAVKLRENVIEV